MAAATEPALGAYKRDMSDGAIAGTVVGVVVAVALLAFCLYPVVIHQIKRRRRAQRPKFDAEAGLFPQPGSGPVQHPNSHRRLSSTDSFKQNGDVARGDFGALQNKEFGWPSYNGHVTQPDGNFGPSRQFSAQTGDGSRQEQSHYTGNDFSNDEPFPYYFENTPAATAHDDSPGVLKGTSADYYSPSIPSSAFGMITTPEPADEPPPTLSRGSSLKHHIKHMFRQQSGRENSLASVLSSNDKATASQVPPGTELGQILTTGHATDSPTELSPTKTSMPPPYVPGVTEPPETKESSASPPQTTIQTPPQSPPPPAERAFQASPSPPTFPAPGTVNPMDIMPASTESEVWHRTEHQLHTSYGSSPGLSSTSDPAEQEHFSTLAFTPLPTSALSPSDAAKAARPATPTNQNAVQGLQVMDENDVPMVDVHSHDHLSPSMIPDNGRHQSCTSDGSTQYHGPHSTGPSTENTPSTQFDSPSPGSMNSSEIRNSASPQPGLASPRTGLFRCDEPGCSQVFDQPHKLKHHQRYHIKEHKCPYKNCGKGFGTKTHLQRHINDRHEKKKKFHCAFPECDYSKAGGKAFPRKDNWKRHMTKIHNMDQQHLPEPIEVDLDMGGT
ncbi:Zinc finger transcription factor ace1 [Metarhizium guizhouense ARSEF 977]|uniref:C2H2 type master regulator of conidiophore development brlA n=1 Tax=Metarhizium guizhouense (strain ARSEF 977) TaxID=1276136 RepID=A0A0B4GQ99_METGA|nr:Zinc finger transcription factor ace1 [Metarhizium guizhouense ARSEF 977]